jgi:hypothetical protein
VNLKANSVCPRSFAPLRSAQDDIKGAATPIEAEGSWAGCGCLSNLYFNVILRSGSRNDSPSGKTKATKDLGQIAFALKFVMANFHDLQGNAYQMEDKILPSTLFHSG